MSGGWIFEGLREESAEDECCGREEHSVFEVCLPSGWVSITLDGCVKHDENGRNEYREVRDSKHASEVGPGACCDRDEERECCDPEGGAFPDGERECPEAFCFVPVMSSTSLMTSRAKVAKAARTNNAAAAPISPTAAPPNRKVDPPRYAINAFPAPGVPLKTLV